MGVDGSSHGSWWSTVIVQGPEVAAWVMEKAGGCVHQNMSSMGWVRDGKLVAGFAFEGWTGPNIVAHQRQEGMAPKGFWGAAARYVFETLGCKRITGPVPASNELALRLNKKIGYEIEATLKEAAPDGGDMILMVLWKDNCRMLTW